MKSFLLLAALQLSYLTTIAQFNFYLNSADNSVNHALASGDPIKISTAFESYLNEFERFINDVPESLNFRKHDSVNEFLWDINTSTWNENNGSNLSLQFDCELGKVTSIVKEELGTTFPGFGFPIASKTDYSYYPNGKLKSIIYASTLDSATWEVYETYMFSIFGKIVEAVSIPNNSSNGLNYNNPQFRAIFNYDNSQQLKIAEFYLPAQAQLPKHRYNLSYNGEGKLLQKVKEIRVSGNTWREVERTLNYYGFGNRLDSTRFQTRYFDVDWQEETIKRFEFDQSNLPKTAILHEFDGAAWVQKYKHDYTYDANQRLTTRFVQEFITSDWANDSLEQLNYHFNGANSSISIQIWRPLLGGWVESHFDSLDMEGKYVVRMAKHFGLDPQATYFSNGGRTTRSYLGSQVSSLTHEVLVDSTADDWIMDVITTFSFDDQGLIEVQESQTFVDSINAFVNYQRIEYYNSSCIIGSAESNSFTTNNCCTYPNPIKVGQTIRCNGLHSSSFLTLKLYDLTGRLTVQKEIDSIGFELPDSLHDGLYYLTLHQGDIIFHQSKIIVKN